MSTQQDRVAVVREALLVKGRIWPNGLGFDRQGWEYIGDAGEQGDEPGANRYQRLVAVERYDEVWFSAADLVR